MYIYDAGTVEYLWLSLEEQHAKILEQIFKIRNRNSSQTPDKVGTHNLSQLEQT